MQIIQIPEGITEQIPVAQGRPLVAGQEYICTNAFAGVMLLSRCKVIINGESWSLRKLIRSYSIDFAPFDPEEYWNYKHIWLYRGGGWGDLLLLTPLIRELRKRWPKAIIHVACGERYGTVFKGIDVITELLPIPYSRSVPIDGLIEFEEIVEGDPRAEKIHMARLFANQAGITLADINLDYVIAEDERHWAQEAYPRNDLPRVGIQLLASAFYRTYAQMSKVMTKLAKKAQILLFGAPGQIELSEPIENVINLMSDKLSFRQSAALVSTCDACLSPDSSLVHVCSALKVPCIGIYGPFPSELRITSPLSFSFNGKAPCAPCFFHADTPDQFPVGMPCFEQKQCVALESIDPDAVVAKVLEIIETGSKIHTTISR